ncbi:glutamine amidotransferase [Ferrovibrio terrae]|uniref:Glutamine amidotransferase n=1 Tax=Ferrovibrio terrae TaxID=2594003 RepID=A0A516H6N3_9PROT|nr:glutamine amidotransferase [Ferrovibrio terrae]QDO99433.1 glutamine amidotransferase [Ferrovibrio terrae]
MKAVALRHVHFEDLGSFAAPIAAAGYDVEYRNADDPDFTAFTAVEPDLLVVLGGPIGVYEAGAYPFLTQEIRLIAERLKAGRPTLGICLGAQLIAAASGAAVYPSDVKEIGFAPIMLNDAGRNSPLRHLQDLPVLHWHGDTYNLPRGATHLASTNLVAQQAFAIDTNVLALQFHPEAVTGSEFERWLVGHAVELAEASIDVRALRRDAARFGGELRHGAVSMISDWLQALAV